MTLWVRTLGMEVSGPEFEPLGPMEKARCHLSAVGGRDGRTAGFASH